MKAPSDMTDRELDAAVAVEVMGWHVERVVPDPPLTPAFDNWCDAQGRGMERVELWSPSTDPSADYSVLVHVRETWGLREQNVFYDLLDHTWAVRTENRHRYVPENVGEYRPGDYARAALAAVRERQ